MLKPFAPLLATALLSLGTVIGAAPSAHGEGAPDSRAATNARSSASPGQCPYGSICAWDDWNYEGSFRAWEGNNPDWHASGFGDRAGSLKNNLRPGGFDAVRLYAEVNYGGDSFCLPRGDFEAQLFSWNNDISSHRLVQGC